MGNTGIWKLKTDVNDGHVKFEHNNSDKLKLNTNNIEIADSLDVKGAISITGPATIHNTTNLQNTLDVTGVTNLKSTLAVTGATTLNNMLSVAGTTNLNNTLAVSGTTTLNNTLAVAGPTNLNNSLAVSGSTTLNNNLAVTGSTSLNNNLAVTGPTNLNNNLAVTGVTNLQNSLNVAGVTNINNKLDVTGVTTLKSNLEFNHYKIANNDGKLTIAHNTNHNCTFDFFKTGILKTSGLIENIYGYVVPLGTIVLWTGLVIPNGWVECKGQSLGSSNLNDRQGLINVLGSNLRLPDFRDRVPIGHANLNDTDNPLQDNIVNGKYNNKSGVIVKENTNDYTFIDEAGSEHFTSTPQSHAVGDKIGGNLNHIQEINLPEHNHDGEGEILIKGSDLSSSITVGLDTVDIDFDQHAIADHNNYVRVPYDKNASSLTWNHHSKFGNQRHQKVISAVGTDFEIKPKKPIQSTTGYKYWRIKNMDTHGIPYGFESAWVIADLALFDINNQQLTIKQITTTPTDKTTTSAGINWHTNPLFQSRLITPNLEEALNDNPNGVLIDRKNLTPDSVNALINKLWVGNVVKPDNENIIYITFHEPKGVHKIQIVTLNSFNHNRIKVEVREEGSNEWIDPNPNDFTFNNLNNTGSYLTPDAVIYHYLTERYIEVNSPNSSFELSKYGKSEEDRVPLTNTPKSLVVKYIMFVAQNNV